MGYGKPIDVGQGLGHKNLAGSLKWRDCAGRIPDWDPAGGVPIDIAAELRQRRAWLKATRHRGGLAAAGTSLLNCLIRLTLVVYDSFFWSRFRQMDLRDREVLRELGARTLRRRTSSPLSSLSSDNATMPFPVLCGLPGYHVTCHAVCVNECTLG